MKKAIVSTLIASLLILTAACGGGGLREEDAQATADAAVAHALAAVPPTNPPRPTNTPNPTGTPRPTNTLAPTNTRTPTNTPRPTSVPVVVTVIQTAIATEIVEVPVTREVESTRIVDRPVTVTPTPAPAMTDVELFKAEMLRVLDTFYTNWLEMSEMLAEAEEKSSDEDWQDEIETRLIVYRELHNELVRMSPPPAMSEAHSLTTDALSDCAHMTYHMMIGFENQDPAELNVASELMASCNEKINQVSGLLDEIIGDVPVAPTVEPTATNTPAPAEATPAPEEPLGVVKSVAFVSERGTGYIMGTVHNGSGNPLKYVKIVASLFNSEGKFAATDYSYMMPEILLPGETVPFSLLIPDAPEFETYELAVEGNQADTEDIEDAYRDLEIGDTIGAMRSTTYIISGLVTNTGDKAAEYVKIMAVIYDENGDVIATEYTYTDLDELAPDATSPFELYVSNRAEGTIGSYELMVEGSVLD